MLSAKRIKIKIIFPSSSPSSLSADIIANNDDLLTQILLRLPIKSLLKFKCVSKHWLSLISNPQLYRRLNISNSPRALFVHRWPRLKQPPEFVFIKLDSNNHPIANAPYKTLTFEDEPSGIRIIQSCNGLLLCSSEANYYVYNPTTERYTILPPIRQADEVTGVYLAFDPSKSPHYKVICVRLKNFFECDYQIEIYSSETGPWRMSTACFTLPILDDDICGGVFWNGAIHWFNARGGPCLYFDIDQEQVKELPMPPIPDDFIHRRVQYFGESRGHLYLVEIYSLPSTQFNVCKMESDYSGWSVKFRVDLDGVVRAFPEMIRTNCVTWSLNHYAFHIMCIVRGENEDDSYLVLHIPGKVIRYEFRDKSFRKLYDFSQDASANYKHEEASDFRRCQAYEYIESLACV